MMAEWCQVALNKGDQWYITLIPSLSSHTRSEILLERFIEKKIALVNTDKNSE